MELKQLIPSIGELSSVDRLLLLQLLVNDLVDRSGLTPLNMDVNDPESNGNISTNHGLHDSFEAAAILAKALELQKATFERSKYQCS
jgi:hypothetical protein